MIRVLVATALLTFLAACETGGGSVSYRYGSPYYYDWGFRYGVYDVHHDVDVDVNLPDRPRPPPGWRPDRPNRPGTGPGTRPNRPSTRPSTRPARVRRAPRRMR